MPQLHFLEIFWPFSNSPPPLFGSFISTEQRIYFKAMLKSLWNRQKAQAALMAVSLVPVKWQRANVHSEKQSKLQQIVILKERYPFIASLCTCSSVPNKRTGTMVDDVCGCDGCHSAEPQVQSWGGFFLCQRKRYEKPIFKSDHLVQYTMFLQNNIFFFF